MIDPFISELIEHPDQATDALFNDVHPGVMWVDWREGDDDIISMAAEALGTPALSPVFENDRLYVRYHDQLTLVPLNFEPGEQDKTLWALSQAIAADYEIRYIKASDGGDTVALMALPLGTWQALETEFGDRVNAAFMRLTESLALFK